MTEEVLDLERSIQLLRRYWRVVAAFVVAGLAAAVGYEVVEPPTYQAASLVLLPSPTTPGPKNNGTTEARIATSAAVLVPAGREAGPGLSLTTLQRDVTASSAATSVLRITATGATPRRAEVLVNAVAGQLVQFLASTGAATNANVVIGLRAEESQLQAQLADVDKELGAANRSAATARGTATTSQQDSQVAAKLTSEQASLALQLASVKSQIAQSELQGIAADRGTEVIQRATSATPPSVAGLVLAVALGAIGGVLVGSVVVLAWRRRDRRLWTRDAIAEATGAPVLASLGVPKRRSPRDWTELFEAYEPRRVERWTMRRALQELGPGDGPPPSVRDLAIAADPGGVAMAVHLALAGAATATRTAVYVAAADGSLSSLRAACSRFVTRDPRPDLVVRTGEPPEPPDRAPAADLVVTVVTLPEARSGAPVAGHPGVTTVLAVSSGFASAEQLAGVAIAAADAGSPVTGVFVANPEAGDQTVGRFDRAARSSSGPPATFRPRPSRGALAGNPRGAQRDRSTRPTTSPKNARNA